MWTTNGLVHQELMSLLGQESGRPGTVAFGLPLNFVRVDITDLSNNVMNHIAMHIGQAEVSP